ncbi:glycosyltransferase [Thiothrix lacustris]|uniref:glycosyltransferase n=1 Tax=Thiothrix lacustris TaxID=525917 RepID=UPI0027E3E3A8|nr:glycosyltransferase [Thiothrix lacustris]WMP18897.1 glycosyltransferase [Thiothrix lacustris]
MPSSPRICGLMLAYFKADMTLKCLRTLAGQGIETIMLVDNSHCPEEHQRTLQLVQHFPKSWLKVVIAEDNLGFAKGMNLALDHARQLGEWDYFLLLNNDITAKPDLVGQLVEYTQQQANQLLFTGRLVEKKGVKYLLQALKEVSKQLPDTTLVIVGSGPLQADLESMTKDLGLTRQVTFTGRLEHKALVRLYQESTVAVFPFVQAKDGDMEGLGLVMAEAMGCGCPVIACDLPAVRDVIMHEDAGYLVESGNISALSRAVLTYLHNPVSPSCIPFAFDRKIIATCYQKTLLHHTSIL